MDVFGIFIAVSFIGLIVTLVVMNNIKRIKKTQEYKPYSEYYVAEKSKDLGLAAKVLSDKPKSEVLTSTYDACKNHNNQELFDTGNMSPIRGYKCDNLVVDDCSWHQRDVNEAQEKYLETLPHHKTRVKNRSKRQRKK